MLDNITLHSELKNIEKVNYLINALSLNKLRDRLGGVEGAELLNTGSDISGGERQRIGIARALYRNPRIVILDESTSGLDYKTKMNIFELIKNICKDKIVIMVSHDKDILSQCSNVLEL